MRAREKLGEGVGVVVVVLQGKVERRCTQPAFIIRKKPHDSTPTRVRYCRGLPEPSDFSLKHCSV